jgi:hypothetical protein
MRTKDDVCTGNDVCTEDNMCAQKPDLPTSDSHALDHLRAADHERACPNLCSWSRSEVRRRSEVILIAPFGIALPILYEWFARPGGERALQNERSGAVQPAAQK